MKGHSHDPANRTKENREVDKKTSSSPDQRRIQVHPAVPVPAYYWQDGVIEAVADGVLYARMDDGTLQPFRNGDVDEL
jgi:hypothetical protein